MRYNDRLDAGIYEMKDADSCYAKAKKNASDG